MLLYSNPYLLELLLLPVLTYAHNETNTTFNNLLANAAHVG
jgi:hypothetical protein